MLFIGIISIISRDLKPENIMLDDKSENAMVKIIDWGAGMII